MFAWQVIFLFLWGGGRRKHWTEIKVNYPELMMSTVSFQLVQAGVHTYIRTYIDVHTYSA